MKHYNYVRSSYHKHKILIYVLTFNDHTCIVLFNMMYLFPTLNGNTGECFLLN